MKVILRVHTTCSTLCRCRYPNTCFNVIQLHVDLPVVMCRPAFVCRNTVAHSGRWKENSRSLTVKIPPLHNIPPTNQTNAVPTVSIVSSNMPHYRKFLRQIASSARSDIRFTGNCGSPPTARVHGLQTANAKPRVTAPYRQDPPSVAAKILTSWTESW